MERKLFVAGQWIGSERTAEVRAPFDGRVVAKVAQASPGQAEEALEFAYRAFPRVSSQSTGRRREVLHRMVEGIKRREKELSRAICDESGKPIKAAMGEVKRAIETFTLAAAELTSFHGRTVPIDLDAASEGYECEVRRFAGGVVVGIVPFNFPLNLGAHKVAPALAVGAPIIIKPPPQAPSAQLILAEIAQEAGADPAALQVLPCDNAVAEKLATDPRVRILSFTGSARVGWHLKSKAPGKALLELGGNAAAVVCADADLDWAAQRCAVGGFTYAGQVCIKVQRILVEAPVYETFVEKLVARAKATPVGDPHREETVVGPVIDDASAERIEQWVNEAKAAGAKVLAGGTRNGRLFSPTVLANAPKDAKVCREEIFGPVIVVSPVRDFDAALDEVNASTYGLQAGIFTHDLRKARQAYHRLEVGGVIVNDFPTFRSDSYPYGGVKASGLGREGVRSSMEELTEERVLVMRAR